MNPNSPEGLWGLTKDEKPSEWIKAWVDRMAEEGYPQAQLTIHNYDNDPMLGYSWMHDVDLFYNTWRTQDPAMWSDTGAWETAHRVFVEVDHLRPRGVRPSDALQARLDLMGRN